MQERHKETPESQSHIKLDWSFLTTDPFIRVNTSDKRWSRAIEKLHHRSRLVCTICSMVPHLYPLVRFHRVHVCERYRKGIQITF